MNFDTVWAETPSSVSMPVACTKLRNSICNSIQWIGTFGGLYRRPLQAIVDLLLAALELSAVLIIVHRWVHRYRAGHGLAGNLVFLLNWENRRRIETALPHFFALLIEVETQRAAHH